MTYIYNVLIDGKWVNLDTLPPEQQAEIKKRLTDKIADAIAVEQAKKCS